VEKPKLFEEKKSFVLTLLVLLMGLAVHLAWEYRSYREFVSQPFYFTHATVLSAYTKHRNQRRYQVLKLQSDEGRTFYTTTHQKRDLSGHRLRLQLFPDSSISFWDYLGTFYVKSRIKQKKKRGVDLKQQLESYVAQQHKDPKLAAFYNAIFFATPLPKELRQKISLLGVSHLVALSGFHLTILWGIVYGILMLLYKPLQQRYFPYRFALIDIGMITIVILGVYVWFVGAPPSLVRSYAMVLVGWSMVVLGVELLSFTFLASVILLLVVLFPSLLASLGFWFSVAGVFYIYLLLHHMKALSKWQLTLFAIPLGIFVLMLPVVHAVFPVSSVYQLFSPLLSLLFIPFYPLAMLLHLMGVGEVLDGMLLWLFSLPKESWAHQLPLWILGLYLILSLVSVKNRRVFYGTLGVSTLYASLLFTGIVF
jgi:competence protein ComEC